MSTWIFDDWNGPKEMNDGWFVDPFRDEWNNYVFFCRWNYNLCSWISWLDSCHELTPINR